MQITSWATRQHQQEAEVAFHNPAGGGGAQMERQWWRWHSHNGAVPACVCVNIVCQGIARSVSSVYPRPG